MTTLSFRSKFEKDLADGPLRGVAYEAVRLPYVVPAKDYIPDFVLPNGIVIEAKGVFEAKDRAKSLRVRDQHPGIDLRFIFQTPHKALSSSSLTSYAQWATKHGFKWCGGRDFEELASWMSEPTNEASLAAIGWQEMK